VSVSDAAVSGVVGSPPRALGAAEWTAIYLGVIAAAFASVLPMLVGVLATTMGVGAGRAGYVAAADMAGGLVGTLLAVTAGRRMSWASAMRLYLSALVAGNVASAFAGTYAVLLPLRFATGVAEGAALAICYSVMGASILPERALGVYCAGQMLLGAVGSLAMPALVHAGGWPAPFLALAILSLPGLALVRTLPTRPLAVTSATTRSWLSGIEWRTYAALGSVLLFFTGAGALYAYLERLGAAVGLEGTIVARSIAASNIAGLSGSLLASIVARAIGRRPGAAAGGALALLAMLAFCADSPSALVFLVACCTLMFAWNVFFPFQFGLLAGGDRTGGASALTHALTGTGLALGPALAAYLVTGGSVLRVPPASVAITLGAMALLAPAALRLREPPAL